MDKKKIEMLIHTISNQMNDILISYILKHHHDKTFISDIISAMTKANNNKKTKS